MPTIPELLFTVGYGLLVHNPMHAGAHAITSHYFIDGARVIEFKPWPGFYQDGFAMDSVTTEIRHDETEDKMRQLGYVPQAMNGTIFATTALGTQFVENKKVKRYIMLAGMFVPLIDASTNYIVGLTGLHGDRNDYYSFNNKETALIGLAITAAWTYAIHEWLETSE